MDPRLQRRYRQVVKAHAQAATGLAAGIAALPGTGTAFAQTMALWRFLNNDRVTLPALVEPLRAAAREALADNSSEYALGIHDWCKLSYGGRVSQRRTLITAPSLLAGLHILLAMLDLLEHYSLDDLKKLARQSLPNFFNSD